MKIHEKNQKKNRIQAQKGFSLIELVLVIVIMGIIATFAIPQYNNLKKKAQRSEAKSFLASMYTAQKAFYVEWNQYYADFNAVGFQLDGDLTYNLAFATPGLSGPDVHNSSLYRGKAPSVVSAESYCSKNPCSILKANTSAKVSGTTVAADTFLFGAASDLDEDSTLDQWTINENKVFSLVEDDIAL